MRALVTLPLYEVAHQFANHLDAGRWLASVSAMNSARSSGSSFNVNMAAFDMTPSRWS